jgi:hypothetical protein
MDWTSELQTASAVVEAWIQRVGSEGWLLSCGSAWTNKDLLGHLTAWSDLLIAQVEALTQERPDTIEAVNVDAWNAEQVGIRRSVTAADTVDDWRRSVRRAVDVIGHVTPDVWTRRWQVAWSAEPVSIDDVLRLWFVHLEQHRARLAGA